MRHQLRLGRTTQWRLMKEGYFKGGVHYFRSGASSHGHLRFNLPACEMALKLYTQR